MYNWLYAYPYPPLPLPGLPLPPPLLAPPFAGLPPPPPGLLPTPLLPAGPSGMCALPIATYGPPTEDRGECGVKRPRKEDCTSPPPHLPSKFQKYRKMKERQEQARSLQEQQDKQQQQSMGGGAQDEEVDKCNNRKCAGTQTAYSSFTSEVYSPAAASTIEHFPRQTPPNDDRYRMHMSSAAGQSGPPVGPPPPYTAPRRASPPLLPAPHLPIMHPAVLPSTPGHYLPPPMMGPKTSPGDNMPLNLTTSSTTHQHHTRPTGPHEGYALPYARHSHSMESSSRHVRTFDGSVRQTETVEVTSRHLHLLEGATRNVPSPEGSSGRPSVITRSAVPPYPAHHPHGDVEGYAPSNGITSSGFEPQRKPLTVEVVNDVDIEEHFRRSLGKDYMARPSSGPPRPAPLHASPSPHLPSPSPPSPPRHTIAHPITVIAPVADSQKLSVSETATVDDHFAKSLGADTWGKLKAQREPMELDMFRDTVDDHFAKALGGDTWFKIKAQAETASPASPMSTSPSGSPHGTTSVMQL